jgi:hypothetical protein
MPTPSSKFFHSGATRIGARTCGLRFVRDDSLDKLCQVNRPGFFGHGVGGLLGRAHCASAPLADAVQLDLLRAVDVVGDFERLALGPRAQRPEAQQVGAGLTGIQHRGARGLDNNEVQADSVAPDYERFPRSIGQCNGASSRSLTHLHRSEVQCGREQGYDPTRLWSGGSCRS